MKRVTDAVEAVVVAFLVGGALALGAGVALHYAVKPSLDRAERLLQKVEDFFGGKP